MMSLRSRLARVERDLGDSPFAPDGSRLCTMVVVRPAEEGETPGWYPPTRPGSSVGELLTERAPHGGATDEEVPEGVLANHAVVIRMGPTEVPPPLDEQTAPRG
jgi:hypothetical protein